MKRRCDILRQESKIYLLFQCLNYRVLHDGKVRDGVSHDLSVSAEASLGELEWLMALSFCSSFLRFFRFFFSKHLFFFFF